MASFEPIIRMDENSFRGQDKIQPKVARKPLTDMTNSRNPLGKERSSVKNLSSFKATENVGQTKVARKPLGDVTNSKQPHVQEKSSKKNCTDTVSAVKKDQLHRFGFGEGFQHNHDECIKEKRLSSTMSLDYFLETVALKRDSAASMPPPWLPQLSEPTILEFDTSKMMDEMEIDFLDICAPSSPSPPTPSSLSRPSSPGWSLDDMNLELKLKDSPVRG